MNRSAAALACPVWYTRSVLRPDTELRRAEMIAQHDMQEHARRLNAFKRATERTVWQEQPNGEWWLVPVIDGASSSSTRPLSH